MYILNWITTTINSIAPYVAAGGGIIVALVFFAWVLFVLPANAAAIAGDMTQRARSCMEPVDAGSETHSQPARVEPDAPPTHSGRSIPTGQSRAIVSAAREHVRGL